MFSYHLLFLGIGTTQHRSLSGGVQSYYGVTVPNSKSDARRGLIAPKRTQFYTLKLNVRETIDWHKGCNICQQTFKQAIVLVYAIGNT